MVRRMKIKWVAPILLTGTLLAGGSAAIAAATSVESGEISEAEAAEIRAKMAERKRGAKEGCLLYTSPSPRDISGSRMPSSA